MRRFAATGVSIVVVLAYAAFVIVSTHASAGTAWSALGPLTIGACLLWLGSAVAVVEAIFVFRAFRPEQGKGPLRDIAEHLRARWSDDFGVSFIWPPVMFGLLLGSFGLFKQELLVRAGFRYDQLFRLADKVVFLGMDPWRITHALPSPWTSLVLDRVYHGWFAPMSLGLIICAFLRRSIFTRTQYMLAFALAWIVIGSVMAYLLPSAGPCYWDALAGPPGAYEDLMRGLYTDQARLVGEVHAGLLVSLKQQDYLLRLYHGGALGLGGGISAMPSMHVALAALFACAAFRIGLGWGMLAAVYAALIFVASVHLGWHYAVDGVVGVAAMLGIWVACGRLTAGVLGPSAGRYKAGAALAPAR